MTIQYLTHSTTTQQIGLEKTLNDLRTTQATKVSKILSILDIDDKAIALQLIKEYSRDKSRLSTKKSKAKHSTVELNLELMDLLELPPEPKAIAQYVKPVTPGHTLVTWYIVKKDGATKGKPAETLVPDIELVSYLNTLNRGAVSYGCTIVTDY